MDLSTVPPLMLPAYRGDQVYNTECLKTQGKYYTYFSKHQLLDKHQLNFNICWGLWCYFLSIHLQLNSKLSN